MLVAFLPPALTCWGSTQAVLRWSKSKRSSELRFFFLFYCQLITRNKPDKPRGKLGQHSNVKSEHTSMTVRNKDVYNKQAFNYFMTYHPILDKWEIDWWPGQKLRKTNKKKPLSNKLVSRPSYATNNPSWSSRLARQATLRMHHDHHRIYEL